LISNRFCDKIKGTGEVEWFDRFQRQSSIPLDFAS